MLVSTIVRLDEYVCVCVVCVKSVWCMRSVYASSFLLICLLVFFVSFLLSLFFMHVCICISYCMVPKNIRIIITNYQTRKIVRHMKRQWTFVKHHQLIPTPATFYPQKYYVRETVSIFPHHGTGFKAMACPLNWKTWCLFKTRQSPTCVHSLFLSRWPTLLF